MKVKEIMVQPVLVVREDTTLAEIARIMLERCIGGLPVVNDRGELRGIVTESDFAAKERGVPFSTFRAPQLFGQWMGKEGTERLYAAARTMTAREIMRERVITVSEEDTLETVLERMLRHDINRVPVVRDGIPVGIVTRHDLLKLMLKACPL
jgi:CBS domain-containing protein